MALLNFVYSRYTCTNTDCFEIYNCCAVFISLQKNIEYVLYKDFIKIIYLNIYTGYIYKNLELYFICSYSSSTCFFEILRTQYHFKTKDSIN